MRIGQLISRLSIASTLAATLLLSGCGLPTGIAVERDVPSASAAGSVFGGQQPVSGATVSVYQMGTSGYGAGATLLASTTTDAGGSFAFPSNAYTCPYANTPVYILSTGGNPGGGTNANLVLVAGLGSCSAAKSTFVNIDEVTTAVTAYALSHFFTTTYGGAPTTDLFGGPAAGSGTYNVGLVMANSSTIPNLVSLAAGTVNPNTSTTTIESAKIYSIANSLAACVNSTGQTSTSETTTNCGKLFSYTAPASGARPLDTLQAAVSMALQPYKNVAAIFNLANAASPFTGLASAPNDWTVGVSYTSSSFGLGINGSSNSRTSTNIDLDATGRVWFPTNTTTSHGLAYFDPVSLSFSGPFATLLTHPQYLAINSQGTVYGSDLAAAHIVSASVASPSVTGSSLTTTGFTGPIAAGYGNASLDGVFYTGGGSAGGPGSTLFEYFNGSLTNVTAFAQPPNGIITYSGTPDTDAATSGSGTVCNYESFQGSLSLRTSTSANPCFAGGITNTTSYADGVMTASSTNQLCDYGGSCFPSPVTLSTPIGIALDGDGSLWVANAGNASVSTLGYTAGATTSTGYYATSTLPYLHNSANGNTMTAPYGIAVDRSGNVWVSNAGCISTNGSVCTPGPFVLSELIGAAAPALTPLAVQNVNGTQGSRPAAIVGGGPIGMSQHTGQPAKRHGR